MQTWMIVSIVIAGVILLVSIAFLVMAHAFSNYIIGHKYKTSKGEDSAKYGVDTSWFDTVIDSLGEENITAFDGINLVAMTLKHKSDSPIKKVAILQHGYHSSPRSMQPYAQMFFDKGFDVYMPAARGGNISGGKYIGMAWLDRFDVMRWIDKVVELYGDDVKIAIMGVSMGGSTVVAVSGMQPPPQVKCAIDDCGFSSQLDEYRACIKNAKLPVPLILGPLSVGVRLKCGYSIGDADICTLAKNSTLPTLFIHGERDSFVPAEFGKKLFDSCGAADKRIELFDAGHAQSIASDKERYAAIFNEFVDKYVSEGEVEQTDENIEQAIDENAQ